MKILTFDVGGSFIKYGVLNENAEILEKGKVKTPMENQAVFLQTLESVKNQYDSIDGMALSLPGIMDAERGYVYVGGALQYNNESDMQGILKQRFALPVSIENDARCAALAEIWKGNLQGCHDAMVMILGTGVGGALIKDGKIHRGKHFFAGELSFIQHPDMKGNPIHGMFGGRASAVGFVHKAKERLNIKDEQFDGKELFEYIKQGNTIAQQALREYADILATEIFNLQAVFDPEKICIGGGISQQPLLLEVINEQLMKLYEALPFDTPHACVDVCRFHNDANLIGACYQWLQRHCIQGS